MVGEIVQMEKLTLSIPEAAKVLGIGSSKMYELVRTGGFPVICVGARKLIPKKGLERWLEAQTEKAMASGL